MIRLTEIWFNLLYDICYLVGTDSYEVWGDWKTPRERAEEWWS